MVNGVEQSTGDSFQRKISPYYFQHLVWIQQHSVGGTDRCRWLWSILDNFGDEVSHCPNELDPSWRSRALNPLLVRAFYETPDEDPKAIEEQACKELGISSANKKKSPSLRVADWETFYLCLDVIHSGYDERWHASRSPTAPQETMHPAQEEPSPLQGSMLFIRQKSIQSDWTHYQGKQGERRLDLVS